MAEDIVTRLLDVVCWCNEFDGVCDACQAADEIEWLREQVRWSSDRASEWKLETYELNTEIERLRAAGDALAKQITKPCRCVEAHDGAINETCAPCAACFDWEEARRG